MRVAPHRFEGLMWFKLAQPGASLREQLVDPGHRCTIRRDLTAGKYSEELAQNGGELDERQTGVHYYVGMEQMRELEDAVGDARRRS
jgi:hypothetical protein